MVDTRNARAENSKPSSFGMIPTLTAVVGLLTFLFSAVQFSINQANANREPFLRKQLEFAFKTSEAVAILASISDPDAWEKARLEFWMLYWGPLSIVEDQDVKNAMIDLGGIVPKSPDPTMNSARKVAMQTQSYQLARRMRELMLKSWDADLPTLTVEKPTGQKP